MKVVFNQFPVWPQLIVLSVKGPSNNTVGFQGEILSMPLLVSWTNQESRKFLSDCSARGFACGPTNQGLPEPPAAYSATCWNNISFHATLVSWMRWAQRILITSPKMQKPSSTKLHPHLVDKQRSVCKEGVCQKEREWRGVERQK